MFKVGDLVRVRPDLYSTLFQHTYDTEDIGTVIEVDEEPGIHSRPQFPYRVKFWNNPDRLHIFGDEHMVRADVQAG